MQQLIVLENMSFKQVMKVYEKLNDMFQDNEKPWTHNKVCIWLHQGINNFLVFPKKLYTNKLLGTPIAILDKDDYNSLEFLYKKIIEHPDSLLPKTKKRLVDIISKYRMDFI